VHRIFDRCPSIKLNISLPLDGFEKTHDRIKNTEGSFKKVIETIEGLASLKKRFSNLNIFIITVVNKLNLNEIAGLAEFIKNNLPVDGHNPSPMRGMPYDKYLLPPSYKEWDNISAELMRFHSYWHRKRMNKIKAFLVTNKIKYQYNIYAQILKYKRMPFKCQAGNIIAVLEPNGDVKLCELTDTIGNVRNNNYDFRKTLFSDQANDMRKIIKRCACTHACFLEPSIRLNPLSLFRSYLWGR
jgi:MoaA/NifB/PqqE/SkfB family radical SAM enzyme